MDIANGMSDLDGLILACKTEQARSYLREAIASYRAGAYRAAIVTTWVAVLYDALDKLRALRLTGHGSARDLLDKFEEIRRQGAGGLKEALSFERDLLDRLHEDLELVSETQLVDLKRLQSDRHRCAQGASLRILIEERFSAAADSE